MILVDAHLDLAYNALAYGRDLTLSLSALRAQTAQQPAGRGIPTVCLPALQEAGVALAFATLFVPPVNEKQSQAENSYAYRTPAEAHRLAMAQLDYYHRLADEQPNIRLVTDLTSLQAVLDSHQPGSATPPLLGLVPLMEGADPIRQPEEVERWYERGLRLIGLAWDDTRYAAGAWRGGGGLSKEGYRLLDRMAEFGLIADLTHLSERASLEVMTHYPGAIVATHSNARALVPGERQLSDRQIALLAEREGVIGVVIYNRFLRAGHQKGDAKQLVTLDHVVAHVDHICQLLGSANHVGIGSDLDGGFGAADIPAEMDSVLDLGLIGERLRAKGYTTADIANIMGENWLRLLQRAWAG